MTWPRDLSNLDSKTPTILQHIVIIIFAIIIFLGYGSFQYSEGKKFVYESDPIFKLDGSFCKDAEVNTIYQVVKKNNVFVIRRGK